MTNEIRDPSPVCQTCGRYLTVLDCTEERCARPAEDEAAVLRDVAELVIGAPVSHEQVTSAMRKDDEMRAKALGFRCRWDAALETWVPCEETTPGARPDLNRLHRHEETTR